MNMNIFYMLGIEKISKEFHIKVSNRNMKFEFRKM